jgi:hypothetical protein
MNHTLRIHPEGRPAGSIEFDLRSLVPIWSAIERRLWRMARPPRPDRGHRRPRRDRRYWQP